MNSIGRTFPAAAAAVLAALTLAACGTTPPPDEALAWVRTDGQSGRSNPALADKFVADKAACVQGSDNAALQAAEPCMAKRGYALVPADQAEAAAAKFRADAAAKGHYAAPTQE